MSRPIAVTVATLLPPYVLESNQEDPVQEQTKFQLRTLVGHALHEVNDALGDGIDLRAIFGEGGGREAAVPLSIWSKACRTACAHGVVGWENFLDDKGNIIEFPGGGWKVMTYLDPNMARELGGTLISASRVDAEQEKNSGPPLP